MLTIRSNQTVPTIAIIRQGKQSGIVHQIGIMPPTVHRSSVVVAAESRCSSPEAPDLWVLDLQPSWRRQAWLGSVQLSLRVVVLWRLAVDCSGSGREENIAIVLGRKMRVCCSLAELAFHTGAAVRCQH